MRRFLVLFLLSSLVFSTYYNTDISEVLRQHVLKAEKLAIQGKVKAAVAECEQILNDTEDLAGPKNVRSCDALAKAYSDYPLVKYYVPCITAVAQLADNQSICSFIWDGAERVPQLCVDRSYTGVKGQVCEASGRCSSTCSEKKCIFDTMFVRSTTQYCWDSVPSNRSQPVIHLCPLALVLPAAGLWHFRKSKV